MLNTGAVAKLATPLWEDLQLLRVVNIAGYVKRDKA